MPVRNEQALYSLKIGNVFNKAVKDSCRISFLCGWQVIEDDRNTLSTDGSEWLITFALTALQSRFTEQL